LEKFEMKKTLVAIAAAAAVTGAMAEATISGQVDLSVNATSTTDLDGTKASANTVGSNQFGQSQLTIGASEDLGDGMSAYANMVFFLSPASNGGGFTQDTGSGVGIKGAFGNIMLGNVYDQVWTVYAAADASGFGATSGAGSAWANTNGVGAKSNSIVYTLPSLVTGLDVTLEQSYNTSAMVTATGVNTYGDASGFSLAYTSGPFYAKYATSRVTVSSTNDFYSYDAYSAAGATPVANSAVGVSFDGTEAKFQALALTYDAGVAKLYIGSVDMSVNNSSTIAEKKSTYGLTVPLGAVTLGWAHSKADFTDDSSTTTSISGDKVSARYALSKRTVAYVTSGRATTSGSDAALTNTSVGLLHSF